MFFEILIGLVSGVLVELRWFCFFDYGFALQLLVMLVCMHKRRFLDLSWLLTGFTP